MSGCSHGAEMHPCPFGGSCDCCTSCAELCADKHKRLNHLELQSIPVPIDPKKSIRHLFGRKRRFIPPLDYSQFELRLLKQAGLEPMIQSEPTNLK